MIANLGDVKLVIIDPISSYLGRGLDSHRNSDVRGVLEPLSEMAERLGVAIVSVTHFAKSCAGNAPKALHHFIGSIAFVAAPRIAFVVLQDQDISDRRLLLHAKNNLSCLLRASPSASGRRSSGNRLRASSPRMWIGVGPRRHNGQRGDGR